MNLLENRRHEKIRTIYKYQMLQDDVFSNVAHLAIPFTFIMGTHGIKYLAEMKKSHAKNKKQQGGSGCAYNNNNNNSIIANNNMSGGDGTCFLCSEDAHAHAHAQLGGAREELRKQIRMIAGDLHKLLSDY